MEITEKDLESKALTLKQQAIAMTVTNVEQYAAAGEFGKGVKELRSNIVEFFAPLKKAAHEAHKSITSKEAEQLKPVDEAIGILRDTMNAFTREQERIRLDEERKAQEKANADAEKERQRLLAQAVKADEKGKTEKAEDLLEQAELVYAAPVTVAPTVDKTVKTVSGSNITQAKETQVSVTDLKAFVAELVKSNPGALASVIDIKKSGLNAFVKANGLDRYPGLNIVKTVGVRF